MSGEWTRKTFESLLNERFRVRPSGSQEEVELTLVEVDGRSQDGLETFSLLFKGPKEHVFPHDTHVVSHADLGFQELFLGPVRSDKNDGVYYQAIFNRIRA